MSTSSTRDLFGGAITVVLPSKLIDASDLRQVPDTQEVFLYPDSNTSIILEVLKRVEPTDPSDAARFHFSALAHDNSALSSNVDIVLTIPNDRGDETPSPTVLFGRQSVQKFNRGNPDNVVILMALYRVESKGVDLVLTMNIPLLAEDGGQASSDLEAAARTEFDVAVRSLKIADFGLFA